MNAAPSTPARPGRLVADMAVITHRNLLRYLRLPQLLAGASIQPLLFLLMFTYVFGNALQPVVPEPYDYLQWLLPGVLIQMTAFGALNTAIGLTEDLNSGVFDRFLSLPMSRTAMLAGRALADLIRNTAAVGLLLALGLLLGFRVTSTLPRTVLALALGLAFAYALSWVMATVALLVKNLEATQLIVSIAIMPFIFISSVFLPTQPMPDWLRVFADHQPVTVIANTMRALMLGPETLLAGQTLPGQLMASITWITAITLTSGLLAVQTYKRAVD